MSGKRVKFLDMFPTPSSILGMSRFYENPRNQPSVRPQFSLAPQTRPDAEPPNQTRTSQPGPPNQTRTAPKGNWWDFLEEPLPSAPWIDDSAKPEAPAQEPWQVTQGRGVGGIIAPNTFGALDAGGSPGLGDVAMDLGLMAAGGVAGKVVGAGLGMAARAGKAYQVMSPANQALYAAMVRGLYHGSRDTGATVAQKFTALSRSLEETKHNWMGADIFGATGKNFLDSSGRRVAEGYTKSLIGKPGTSAFARSSNAGPDGLPIVRGAKFRLSEPMSTVANRKILDLTENTLDKADPALYRELSDFFAEEIRDAGTDLAKLDFSKPGLHQARYNPLFKQILEDFGYDTVKHLSGQVQGKIVTPVYAFMNSAGMKVSPTLPSVARSKEIMGQKFSDFGRSFLGQ